MKIPRPKETKEKFATLNYEGKEYQIPIIAGTDGQDQLDIQALYGKFKLFCYDPGYTITSSCRSAITNITSDGKIFYRGYAIEDLVEKSNFLEVCFILIYGRQC